MAITQPWSFGDKFWARVVRSQEGVFGCDHMIGAGDRAITKGVVSVHSPSDRLQVLEGAKGVRGSGEPGGGIRHEVEQPNRTNGVSLAKFQTGDVVGREVGIGV